MGIVHPLAILIIAIAFCASDAFLPPLMKATRRSIVGHHPVTSSSSGISLSPFASLLESPAAATVAVAEKSKVQKRKKPASASSTTSIKGGKPSNTTAPSLPTIPNKLRPQASRGKNSTIVAGKVAAKETYLKKRRKQEQKQEKVPYVSKKDADLVHDDGPADIYLQGAKLLRRNFSILLPPRLEDGDNLEMAGLATIFMKPGKKGEARAEGSKKAATTAAAIKEGEGKGKKGATLKAAVMTPVKNKPPTTGGGLAAAAAAAGGSKKKKVSTSDPKKSSNPTLSAAAVGEEEQARKKKQVKNKEKAAAATKPIAAVIKPINATSRSTASKHKKQQPQINATAGSSVGGTNTSATATSKPTQQQQKQKQQKKEKQPPQDKDDKVVTVVLPKTLKEAGEALVSSLALNTNNRRKKKVDTKEEEIAKKLAALASAASLADITVEVKGVGEKELSTTTADSSSSRNTGKRKPVKRGEGPLVSAVREILSSSPKRRPKRGARGGEAGDQKEGKEDKSVPFSPSSIGADSRLTPGQILQMKDASSITQAELRTVVNSCLRRQDWKGLRLLAGATNGLPLTKDLLDMCVTVTAKAGRSKTARALVDLMILRGDKPDMKTYNALLPAILGETPTTLAQTEAVDSFLNDLTRRGLRPDRVTFNTIIKHYASQGDEGKASQVLSDMLKVHGIAPDVVSYTTVISACGRNWERAMSLLKEAEALNWERAMALLKEAEALVGEGKDGRLYTATMRICGAAGKRERVLELFRKMRRVVGLQQSNTRGGEMELSDFIAYNAVLEALKVEGDAKQAVKVLQEMRDAGLVPNTVNHNTVLDALAEAGHADEALNLLNRMKVSSVKPDKRSYTAAIKAMVKTANVAMGRQLFEEMTEKAKIVPDAVTYTTMMELYGAAGNKSEMEVLISKMSAKRGFPKDVRAFTAVIRAYGRAGLWQEALALLSEMKIRGVRPTIVSYGTCMSALAASGRHKEAFELLDIMEKDGVQPNDVVFEWVEEACRAGGRLDKLVKLKWRR